MVELQPLPHAEAELIDGLEPDQLVASAAQKLPRMVIGPAGRIGLWVLRVFVLLISVLVAYTFAVSLSG